MNKIIYLAGPDVFLPCAAEVLQDKRVLLEEAGYTVHAPLDNQLTDARDIYLSNIQMIQRCDIVVADLTPFRGTEPDAGTVFEVGFAVGIGKKVLTYNNPKIGYNERVKKHLAEYKNPQAFPWQIEQFGLTHNLMISMSTQEFTTFLDVLEYLTI